MDSDTIKRSLGSELNIVVTGYTYCYLLICLAQYLQSESDEFWSGWSGDGEDVSTIKLQSNHTSHAGTNDIASRSVGLPTACVGCNLAVVDNLPWWVSYCHPQLAHFRHFHGWLRPRRDYCITAGLGLSHGIINCWRACVTVQRSYLTVHVASTIIHSQTCLFSLAGLVITVADLAINLHLCRQILVQDL